MYFLMNKTNSKLLEIETGFIFGLFKCMRWGFFFFFLREMVEREKGWMKEMNETQDLMG